MNAHEFADVPDDISDSVCAGSPGLTDLQRSIVIVAHYLAFPAVTAAMYALYRKGTIIAQRIYSPFILLMALTWLQLGTAFEIGNHFYTSDWGLEIQTTDLINGSFGFFNFGAVNIIAIALKKKSVPVLRLPKINFDSGLVSGLVHGLVDVAAILGDIFLLLSTVSQPFLYYTLGREESNSKMIPASSFAGVFTLLRLWMNLGPNKYTFWGGTLFLVLTLSGVAFNVLYGITCMEFLHIFIGGSFVSSMIPFTIALWHAELPGPNSENNDLAKRLVTLATGRDDSYESIPLVNDRDQYPPDCSIM